MGRVNPGLEMRRLAGKVAMLLAGIYVIVLVSVVAGAVAGNRVHLIGWLTLPIPAFVFVPAVRDAVRLHQTTDPQAMTPLWRRSLVFALAGTALLFSIAVALSRLG